ncbi:putative transcription factor C3H family [Arabidopsis thaliana]
MRGDKFTLRDSLCLKVDGGRGVCLKGDGGRGVCLKSDGGRGVCLKGDSCDFNHSYTLPRREEVEKHQIELFKEEILSYMRKWISPHEFLQKVLDFNLKSLLVDLAATFNVRYPERQRLLV